MRNSVFVILTILFLFCPIYIHAGNTVLIGKVYAGENPIKGVSVTLLNMDSTVASKSMTSDIGLYKFENIKKSKYIMRYNCIGYDIITVDLEICEDTVVLDDIFLKEKTFELNEVNVSVQRYLRTDNALIVYPSKVIVKYSFSGYDLLSNIMIPGLTVDKQKGAVKRFKTDVAIYINGDKADSRQILNLHSDHVEKIEYIDNPTGKYSNDDYAINFITRKRESGGYVSFDTSETIGYEKGEYNASSQISSKNNTFSFWGGINHIESSGISIQRDEIIKMSQSQISIYKNVKGENFQVNEKFLHAQMRRVFNKGSWTFKLGFISSRSPQNNNRGIVLYKDDNYENVKNQHTKVNNNGFSPKLSWYGEFNFNKESQLTCTFSMDYNHNIYDRTYIENDYVNYTNAKNKFTNGNSEINYSYKFKNKSNLSFTVYNFLSDATTLYTGNKVSEQSLFSDEILLFIGYKIKLKKNLSAYIRPGMSILCQRLNGLKKNETAFRLHSRLSCEISQNQQLTLKYNIGNTSADISSSSNLDQTIDSYHIKRGNPNLKSAHLYHLSLEYMLATEKLNLTFGADYHKTDKVPLMTPYLENNKIIETYSSDSKSKEYDMGAVAAFIPCEGLSIQAMLLYSRLISDKWKIYNTNIIMSSINVVYNIKSLSFRSSFAPPYNSVKAGKGGISAKLKNDWQYNIVCSWKSKILYIETGFNNFFSKKTAKKEFIYSPYYSYEQRNTSKMYQQFAYIKIACNIEFGNKKVKKDKTKFDNSIKDSILK